jgi:spore coat polysaccharide biosynthesis protein SpsF (cytidylyltransferase family)
MGKNIVAIIQCRNGSSRLPDKGIVDLGGKYAIQYMVDRIKISKFINEVVVAVPDKEENDSILKICKKAGIETFKGEENDVLQRVLDCAKEYKADIIVELTADCPLQHWNVLDKCIESHLKLEDSSNTITTNVYPRSYPQGYDVRIYNMETLKKVDMEVDNEVDREHVATWMYLNPKGSENYKVNNVDAEQHERGDEYSVTLDTEEDLELIRTLIDYSFEYRVELAPYDVVNALRTYPHFYTKVQEISRKDYFDELRVWKEKNKDKIKKPYKLNFGKMKGKTIKEIFKIKPGYIDYLKIHRSEDKELMREIEREEAKK